MEINESLCKGLANGLFDHCIKKKAEFFDHKENFCTFATGKHSDHVF